jgi:hypothetical protein
MVCNGHGNHSVNVKDEGSQLVDIRMVGGIVYICVCGFSVNVQFNVIVISGNGQVKVL